MRRLRIPFWTKKSATKSGIHFGHFKLVLFLVVAPWSIALAATGNRILKVELSRSSCFGQCPVYEVAIDSTGRVNYKGVANVAVNGGSTARISAKSYDRVVESIEHIDFKHIDFFRKGDQKVINSRNDENCPSFLTDRSEMTITVFYEGLAKTIKHNLGCSGLPKQTEFVELGRLIDREANTMRWIKRFGDGSKH
jgi:hypothetical protein